MTIIDYWYSQNQGCFLVAYCYEAEDENYLTDSLWIVPGTLEL